MEVEEGVPLATVPCDVQQLGKHDRAWVLDRLNAWMDVIDPSGGHPNGAQGEPPPDPAEAGKYVHFVVALKAYGIHVEDPAQMVSQLTKLNEETVTNRILALTREVALLEFNITRLNMRVPIPENCGADWKLAAIKHVVVEGGKLLKYQLSHTMLVRQRKVSFEVLSHEYEFTAFKFKDYQALMLFTIGLIREAGLRKGTDGWLFKEVRDAEGRPLRYWKRASSVRDFVSAQLTSTLHPAHWQTLKTGNNYSRLVEDIANNHNPDVPEIKRDRHLFSFLNGVFDVRDLTLTPHAALDDKLGSTDVVACRFFDCEVPDDWLERAHQTITPAELPGYDEAAHGRLLANIKELPSAYLIPTAGIQKILEDQRLDPLTIACFYFAVGRLLFEVGEADNYQFAIFVKGYANTGKSSLLQAIQKLWEPDDVGIIRNKGQEDFQGASLFNRYAALAFDVTEKFNLDQSLLQSMITGEGITLNVKGKNDVILPKWIVPIVFSGNKVPLFSDNAGAISRRFLIFAFYNKINSVLGGLLEQILRTEIGPFLVKSAMCYEWGRNYFRETVMTSDKLPAHFSENSKKMRYVTSPLLSFLKTEKAANRLAFEQPEIDGKPQRVRDAPTETLPPGTISAGKSYLDSIQWSDPANEVVTFESVKNKKLILMSQFSEMLRQTLQKDRSGRPASMPLDYNEDYHGDAFIRSGIEPKYVTNVRGPTDDTMHRVLIGVAPVGLDGLPLRAEQVLLGPAFAPPRAPDQPSSSSGPAVAPRPRTARTPSEARRPRKQQRPSDSPPPEQPKNQYRMTRVENRPSAGETSEQPHRTPPHSPEHRTTPEHQPSPEPEQTTLPVVRPISVERTLQSDGPSSSERTPPRSGPAAVEPTSPTERGTVQVSDPVRPSSFPGVRGHAVLHRSTSPKHRRRGPMKTSKRARHE